MKREQMVDGIKHDTHQTKIKQLCEVNLKMSQ